VMRMADPQRPGDLAGGAAPGGIQRLCAECEEEVRRQPVEDEEEDLQMKRASGATAEIGPGVQAQIGGLHGGGRPLSRSLRTFFEPRFGRSFDHVRIHTDPPAAAAARAINASAFTLGSDIAFAHGPYRPNTRAGRYLLSHELTHIAQQGPEADPVVRRDLLAYNQEQVVSVPPTGIDVPEGSVRTAGNAPEIRAALEPLIGAGVVELRQIGSASYFSADPAQHSSIERVLSAAGFAKAGEMADAMIQQHETLLYTAERTIALGEETLTRETDSVGHQYRRPLTGFEASEARIVYEDALDLSRFEIIEDPTMSIGGVGRSLSDALYIPPRTSIPMPWLIHELMHQWQYQHGYWTPTLAWYALKADYDYGGEAGLRAASAAGRSITSFNTEEQGDIMEDFYERTKGGHDVTAWMPFVEEVRNA
ncbi:MAG: DUF4157 domain-containing protein, partial [Geminicoccaceae bacterium]